MTDSFDIRNVFASLFTLPISLFTLSPAALGSAFGIRPVPVCLWFLAKNKTADAKRGFRDRRHLINAGLAKA